MRRMISAGTFIGGLIGWLILAATYVACGDEVAVVELPPVKVSELAAVARQDREQFAEDEHPFIYYLVADPTTAKLLCWVLSSTSLTQEIELCQPVPIVPGLTRIDIRTLGWRHEDWQAVLEKHPYGGYVMLVRGDWLITELLDCQLSASQHEDGIAAYYRLLYGDKAPKTETDFLAFWEVDNERRRHRGQVEGISQVNRRGRRWIETRDLHGGYFWITRDSQVLRLETDPLERPDGSFVHDGSEAIVGLTKFSARTQERGSVQYYILTDGQGQRVDEAPVQLVEDSTRFRNIPSIRTWGSCVQCHVEGIRPVESNALVETAKRLRGDGKEERVFSYDSAEIRRFHYGSLDRDIERAQEDYVAGVRLHTGWTVPEMIQAIETVVRGYDSALSLERASQELGVEPARLQSAITSYGQPIPAGIAVMVAGGSCSRDLFAQQYQFLSDLLAQ